jgi:hypothetical protein
MHLFYEFSVSGIAESSKLAAWLLQSITIHSRVEKRGMATVAALQWVFMVLTMSATRSNTQERRVRDVFCTLYSR